MTDLISVIVPIYNGEQYLARCLDSLKRQTVQNIEFLLIDDGSTDGSAAICRQYAENDNRFKYHYKENGGVSSARNLGLDLAAGEYIGFCDCDDWVDDDYYECLYRMMRDSNADIAALGIQNEDGNSTSEISEKGTQAQFPAKDVIKANASGYPLQSVWTKLFRKDVLSGLQFDSTITIGEDLLFCMAASLRANVIAFDSSKKYHYFWRDTSATKQYYKESKWTERDAYLHILQLTGDANQSVHNWTVNMLLHCDIRLSCIAQKAKRYTPAIHQMVKEDYAAFLKDSAGYRPSFSLKCIGTIIRAPMFVTAVGLKMIYWATKLKCLITKKKIDGLT